MSPLVLVLDQGGHSSRALVFDNKGEVIARASMPVSTLMPQPGWIEQDAGELVTSLHTVLAQVANQLGERCADLQAAALIVQRSSLVAWDTASRTVLSPVLSWQDTRHAAWLETILHNHAGVDEKNIRQTIGLYPNAHYGASKIRWLLDNVPAVARAEKSGTLCIAPLASFLQQALTGATSGKPVVDAVIASRTLLTALGATTWSPELLSLFGIPETILPLVRPTIADYGVVRIGNSVTGFCDVPLQLLGGDQSFFAMSQESFSDQSTVFINAGTGAFVQQRMPASRTPGQLLCSPVLVASNPCDSFFVAEGTVNAAATALDWFWQGGAGFSAEAWQHALEQANNAPESMPYFVGRMVASGSPDWLPAGESFFSRNAATALQAVAVVESIVFGLQRNLDCLASVQPCEKIIVSGGLSKLDVFCQRLADVSGKPVLRSHDVEACARGAAMQLLPSTMGDPAYSKYMPQPSEALQKRYADWCVVLQGLS